MVLLYNNKRYRSIIGSLLWINRITRLEITTYVVSKAASVSSSPKQNHLDILLQGVRLKPSDARWDDAYGRAVSSQDDGDFGWRRLGVFTTRRLSVCVSLLDFRRSVFIFFVFVVVYVVALAFAPPLVLGD